MRATTILLSTALTLCASASFAQTSYNYVVEPVTQSVDEIINSPIEYNEDGVIKAQYFNADHLTDEEYQAVLAEAARIEAYRDANGLNFESEYVSVNTPAYVAPTTVTTTTSSPSYQVELFAPEATTYSSVSHTSATSYATTTAVASHIISKGDTLYSLSKRYNTSVASIQAENGMSGTQLSIGQEIRIPGIIAQTHNTIAQPIYASSTSDQGYISNYVVEPTPQLQTTEARTIGSAERVYAVLAKDTLYKISRFTCVSVKDIISRNGITNPDALNPGDKLTLPAGNCLSR